MPPSPPTGWQFWLPAIVIGVVVQLWATFSGHSEWQLSTLVWWAMDHSYVFTAGTFLFLAWLVWHWAFQRPSKRRERADGDPPD